MKEPGNRLPRLPAPVRAKPALSKPPELPINNPAATRERAPGRLRVPAAPARPGNKGQLPRPTAAHRSNLGAAPRASPTVLRPAVSPTRRNLLRHPRATRRQTHRTETTRGTRPPVIRTARDRRVKIRASSLEMPRRIEPPATDRIRSARTTPPHLPTPIDPPVSRPALTTRRTSPRPRGSPAPKKPTAVRAQIRGPMIDREVSAQRDNLPRAAGSKTRPSPVRLPIARLVAGEKPRAPRRAHRRRRRRRRPKAGCPTWAVGWARC